MSDARFGDGVVHIFTHIVKKKKIRLTPDGAVAKVVKLLIDYYGIVSLWISKLLQLGEWVPSLIEGLPVNQQLQ